MSSRTRNFKSKPNTSKLEYRYKDISVIYFIPLLLIVGLVPLITYGKYIKLPQIQQLYWVGGSEYLDFFSYWKSKWVVFLTGVATVEYIYLYWTKKLPFKREWKYYIPLLIYVLCVILSTIFAVDVDTALNGFVDMYQGMWVLISYALITFLTINFVNSERDLKLFCYAFVFLIIVEGALGLGQYIGYDFFKTELGNKLILPSDIIVEELTFNFGKHTIYGTLFNTNYVGSFAALVLPLSVAFLMSSKTIFHRVLSGLTVFFSLVLWIGCNSRAGYVGVAVGAIFALFLFRREIVKHYKVSLIILAVVVVGIAGMCVVDNALLPRVIERMNFVEQIRAVKEQSQDPNRFKVNDIILKDNYCTIDNNRANLTIRIENGQLYYEDDEYNKLPTIKDDNGIVRINDDRYSIYEFHIYDSGSIVEMRPPGWTKIVFYIGDNYIRIIGSGGRITVPMKAEYDTLLEGLEDLGSGRGYIWSRSIPLLKESLLIGKGADTFPIVFPQDDYVAKVNVLYMNSDTIVDKPHNMYLQIGIHTGMLSLLSMILIWTFYIGNSIYIYSNIQFDRLESKIGYMCFVAVIGYLIAGIFNDYIVSVAPIYYLILGLGISINGGFSNKFTDEVTKFAG